MSENKLSSSYTRTVRWDVIDVPIPVYMMPFYWYENTQQRQGTLYHDLVRQAMDAWSNALEGIVRFEECAAPQRHGIIVRWQRVNKSNLGYCTLTTLIQNRICSAEIEIGLTDGQLFEEYDNPQEVYATILHELGHALGLKHTDNRKDIMYGEHIYGICQLSSNDIRAAQKLYQLPIGFDYAAAAKQIGLNPPIRLDTVLAKMDMHAAKHLPTSEQQPEKLEEQHRLLCQRNQIQLAMQGTALRLNDKIRKHIS